MDELIICIDTLEFDSNDQSRNEVKTLAYYYYRINLIQNNIDTAIEKLSAAMEIAALNHLPELIHLEAVLKSDNKLYEKLIRTIIDSGLVLEKSKRDPLSYSETHNYKYLLILFESDNHEFFEELFNYTLINLYQDTLTENELYFNLAGKSLNLDTSTTLLKEAIKNNECTIL
ncbi:MAG: hypothetical protein OMM_01527 [Candidatus Magnetoglobus multicellularis str. Araruama]|uniref:Uncharacterized protein n=1 Tax=Candidatus Magnetoglobus multicellularis str. Araruama TaxID=890399 RepID=A0A1V1PCV6_9BACT|nr:MAG: hypothetical protein OMM_01527 [Candidatus Magnetoglobus multicellularis str. Araruama]